MDGCKKCLRLGGKGVLQASAGTHARLGENAANAQADLAELKAAQARGSLLDAEAVEREWSDVLGTVRTGMLAVPSRAGARLPHLTGHNLRVAPLSGRRKPADAELGHDLVHAPRFRGGWGAITVSGTRSAAAHHRDASSSTTP